MHWKHDISHVVKKFMKGRARSTSHIALAVLMWMVFTAPPGDLLAYKQTHVLLLITPALQGDHQEDLVQSVEAHLAGLPIIVHTTTNASLDVRDVSAAKESASFFKADSVVWTNSDLSDARFWNMTGDSPPQTFSVADTDEGWLPRCEAFASIVLSMTSPLLPASATPQKESTSAPTKSQTAPPQDTAKKKSDSANAQGSMSKPVEPADAYPFATLQFRIGLNFPTSRLNPSVIAGVGAEIVLPPLDNRLSIALDASFTRPRLEGKGNDPDFGAYSYVNNVYELKFALDLIFRPLGLKYICIPILGVGPAVQFLKTTQTSTLSEGRNFEQSWEIGLEALLGLDVALGPGFLVLEARYLYTDLDHQLTGDTNGGNVAASFGYRFGF